MKGLMNGFELSNSLDFCGVTWDLVCFYLEWSTLSVDVHVDKLLKFFNKVFTLAVSAAVRDHPGYRVCRGLRPQLRQFCHLCFDDRD
jgi:hypothetical protein